MEVIGASLFILFLTILCVPFANRFRLPLEIFLVIGSCIISLIPGLPTFRIEPEMVFYLFLPIILFYAAYFTSWQDFKFNFRPISLLAFGLTLFTTIIVAVAVKFLIPGFTWAEGFLLGAIVSPTDASSAIAIIKKIGAPRTLTALLAGESLINDAAALILFRFSLVAIVSGSFSLSKAVTMFFVSAMGGALVGILIGLVAVRVLKYLEDIQAEITLTFMVAFTCYLLAEYLGVSGIIATVVCGIYFGRYLPDYMSSRSRINARATWDNVLFIMNAFIFTFIGFELPLVLKSVRAYTVPQLLIYGVIISIMVIGARILWLLPGMLKPRLYCKGIQANDPVPAWKKLFLLGWSGMRGIVSLAAALSIPFTISVNQSFPHRELIVFLTYFVVVVTLVLPTFLLPILLKLFKLQGFDSTLKEESIARLKSLEGVIERLAEVTKKENIPIEIFNEFKKQINRRLTIIRTQLEDTPYSTLVSEYFAIKKLALTAITAEKETLINLRKSGEIHDEVFHRLLEEIDVEEVRARSVRI